MKKLLAWAIAIIVLFSFLAQNCSRNFKMPTVPATTFTATLTPTLSSAQKTQTAIANITLTAIATWWTATPTNTPAPCSSGNTWTQATGNAAFSVREGHTSVVFNNAMWVIGGYNGTNCLNDVWHSNDGSTWTQSTAAAQFTARYFHTSVVFNNEIWVIAGSDPNGNDFGDIWYSSDGSNWACAATAPAFGARAEQSSVVFNNEMWVIAGANNTVGIVDDAWASTDGSVWSQVTGAAAFNIRAGHTSLVFYNEIWVIAGIYINLSNFTVDCLNDVWNSTDGNIWSESTANANFSQRYVHSSIVFNNEMWVIGGGYENTSGGGYTCYNDVWYSNNGSTWTRATSSAGFTARGGHSSVAYNNRMWVVGGMDVSNKYYNDVWWSQ